MDHHLIDDELPRHERELTLSTGSILGIFLGLVVLCGGFFGFGYNMGRKSAPTPLNMSDVASESTLPTTSTATKPAAGSPVDTIPPTAPVTPAPRPVRHTAPPSPPPDETASDDETPKPPPAHTVTPAPAPIIRQPAPVAPSSLSPSAAASPGTGTYMVQVAAVSHQEDAQLLLSALRSRGYAVSARPASGDSFIHVQVGPFHDKKEADAMRQRLITDGYNAIVK